MADELDDPTLAAIAAALDGCFGAEFQARLRRRLERSIDTMSTTSTPMAPATARRLTPFLITDDVDSLVTFATRVFGAEEVHRAARPEGGTHSELRIGDSRLRIRGSGPGEPQEPRMLGLHVYVDDVDAVYARALAEGARSLGAPEDRHYGERSGFVADMAGNHWYIAKRIAPSYFTNPGTVNVNLYVRRTAERTGAGFIAFLEAAFGAQVEARFDRGEMVGHAVLRLGETALELGEGTEPSFAAPAALVLDVDDADAMYARALAAGASSLISPEQRPFGRMGAVRDPWGNDWYITQR